MEFRAPVEPLGNRGEPGRLEKGDNAETSPFVEGDDINGAFTAIILVELKARGSPLVGTDVVACNTCLRKEEVKRTRCPLMQAVAQCTCIHRGKSLRRAFPASAPICDS